MNFSQASTARGQMHGKGLTTRDAAPGFGEALRRYRKRAGMSQWKLGRLSGIEHSYISRLESTARNPSRETVAALSAALDLPEVDAARLYLYAGFLPACVPVDAVVALVALVEAGLLSPGVDAEAVVALVEAGR